MVSEQDRNNNKVPEVPEAPEVPDLEKPGKKKVKKIHWILIYWLGFFCVFILLLLYKPADFKVPAAIEGKQVSRYLTHVLYPKLYNGAQSGKPFDLTVLQEGINDIVVRNNWPIERDGVKYLTPEVFFKSGQIELVGIVVTRGVRLIVTIAGRPVIDKKGLLNLNVVKIKIGAMSVTILAKIIAKRMYKHQLATVDVTPEDIRTKIAGSLLSNEPFEPIFPINNRKVRIKAVDIVEGELKLQFVGAS